MRLSGEEQNKLQEGHEEVQAARPQGRTQAPFASALIIRKKIGDRCPALRPARLGNWAKVVIND